MHGRARTHMQIYRKGVGGGGGGLIHARPKRVSNCKNTTNKIIIKKNTTVKHVTTASSYVNSHKAKSHPLES